MSQDEADFEAAVDECISSGEDASPGSTSDCDSFVSVDSQVCILSKLKMWSCIVFLCTGACVQCKYFYSC